jgi:hypothetical protein
MAEKERAVVVSLSDRISKSTHPYKNLSSVHGADERFFYGYGRADLRR